MAAIKVRELIEQLTQMPQEAVVIIVTEDGVFVAHNVKRSDIMQHIVYIYSTEDE